MGVWIEISKTLSKAISYKSLPLWECGLKLTEKHLIRAERTSLPLWECGLKLEICLGQNQAQKVTPFMGVWIEISPGKMRCKSLFRHSLYGSVDWNLTYFICSDYVAVTPFMGVWIEINYRRHSGAWWRCHSLYGSVDWNQNCQRQQTSCLRSLPLWECGLKSGLSDYINDQTGHSLYGSVDWNWTEWGKERDGVGHSLYGSVDWNNKQPSAIETINGHSLYGSVDWNYMVYHIINNTFVTPFMGVWIEILTMAGTLFPSSCHSLYGSVDWNETVAKEGRKFGMSLPLWECGLKFLKPCN